MQELQNLLNENARRPFMSSQEVLDTKVQLERLNKQYNKLIENEDRANIKSSTMFTGMQKGIEKATSKIKRFGLALFGIRSIYSLISRASSAYLSQDTELANKLQAVWIGLGSMLEPIISAIANTLIKAVKYINIFITALTGVNMLEKAMQKSISKTNGGLKTQNKLLAGFDELTNINTDTGSAGGIDTSWINAFENVSINMEWADKITQFGDWISKHKELVLGLFEGIAITIETIKIMKLINGLGLFEDAMKGILALGIGVILLGIVETIKAIVEFIKDPSWGHFADVLAGLSIILAGVAIAMLAVNAANPIAWIVATIAMVVALAAAVIKNWDTIKQTLSKVGSWINEHIITPASNFFGNLWSKIKDGVSNAVQTIKDKFSTVKTFLSNIVTTVIELFRNIGTKVGDGISSAFKTVINSVLKSVQNILNTPIKAINKLLDTVNSIPGVNLSKLNTFSFPQLATGTNYVPEDQMAYIHKGEAVVPKKFNSDEYFGRGNEETNELLQTLIEKVEDIEIHPYTTIKDVGKTAVDYINNKTRQIGRSVIA